jgi:hypothetical protein
MANPNVKGGTDNLGLHHGQRPTHEPAHAGIAGGVPHTIRDYRKGGGGVEEQAYKPLEGAFDSHRRPGSIEDPLRTRHDNRREEQK